ncbi:MAG TPA: TonB-dependent receptor, partial [Patescibacteria group bacterium]|nr:TonB-dependent receptor [Patescibacteria group bacterium]
MAQNKDSIFITKPVEVEAIRHIDRNSSALTPVSIISIDELKNTGAWQVSDGLAFTPGIFIRNYGGLGGLKTVSLRGANASQTTILLNGVRLNSSQNGQFDLSTLPASFVDEIEVMRGGSSMMFGGNAIAGAINIKTQKGSEGNALTTHLSYGSFQSSLLSVSGNLPISDSLNLFAIGEFSGSKGDYSFDSEQFGEIERLQRSNGDFKNLTGLAVVQFPFLSLQWNAQGLYRATNRGTPGAVLQGRVESSNARLQEYDRLISLSADKEFSEGASLTMLLSGRGNTMVYDDPDMSFTTNKGISTFDNNEYSVRSVLRLFLSKTLAEITAEGILAELSGDNLQPGVGKYINRIQAGIGGRVEHEIHTDSLLKITLHTGIRFDHFSDRGNSVSPLLGAGFSFFKNLLIRTQWSYNFRPPTFNEMYYLNYGNALLRPEKSHSFNLGAVWQPVSFSYTEVELFLIRTSDQIAGVPKNPVQWSAQNIGLVIS